MEETYFFQDGRNRIFPWKKPPLGRNCQPCPKQMNSLFISVFSPSGGDSVATSMVQIRKLNKNHLFKALLKNNCLVTMAMCYNLVTRCMNVWIPCIIPGMQVPERILALWKPFLRLFQRMNLLPPLLQSLVSKISEHGSQLDRLLMCWTISIANSLCNTGNNYFSKQQEKYKCFQHILPFLYCRVFSFRDNIQICLF